jgi:hypothetical protein
MIVPADPHRSSAYRFKTTNQKELRKVVGENYVEFWNAREEKYTCAYAWKINIKNLMDAIPLCSDIEVLYLHQ